MKLKMGERGSRRLVLYNETKARNRVRGQTKLTPDPKHQMRQLRLVESSSANSRI